MDFFIFASEQWFLLSIFLLLIYTFIWRESSKGGRAISHHELTRLINSDQAMVVDIRDNKEFDNGHIAGAINIPFNKLGERASELEPEKESLLVLVDKMGQHSGTAGRQLAKQGFNVQRLSGGMMDWVNEKLPTVRS